MLSCYNVNIKPVDMIIKWEVNPPWHILFLSTGYFNEKKVSR
jgi:hypothetical protein